MLEIDKTKQIVEGEIRLLNEKVKDAYDDLESLSAKVKLWVSLNRVKVAVLAGSHVAAFIIGLIC